MPGMDGATLLAKVARLQPDAVRIVLSGHAEPETIGRVAAVAHRILVKPSPIDVVARVIERSCVLLDVTGEVRLIQAARTSELPSAPTAYFELVQLLGSGDANAAQIAAILERDIAMSVKVLQLANSAYFGRRHPVSGLRDAVTLLGHDTLQALALSAEVFQKFRIPSIAGFSLEGVQHRSLQVGRLAHNLSKGNPEADDAFAAGLLLNVGMLVLAVQEPEYLAEVLLAAKDEGRPVHEIERERHGITHAEIGAHLLALWGLPHTIVEAVAHHHDPLRSPDTRLRRRGRGPHRRCPRCRQPGRCASRGRDQPDRPRLPGAHRRRRPAARMAAARPHPVTALQTAAPAAGLRRR